MCVCVWAIFYLQALHGLIRHAPNSKVTPTIEIDNNEVKCLGKSSDAQASSIELLVESSNRDGHGLVGEERHCGCNCEGEGVQRRKGMVTVRSEGFGLAVRSGGSGLWICRFCSQ